MRGSPQNGEQAMSRRQFVSRTLWGLGTIATQRSFALGERNWREEANVRCAVYKEESTDVYYSVVPGGSLYGHTSRHLGCTSDHGQIFDSEGRWLLDPEIKGKKVHLASTFNLEGVTLGGHAQSHAIGLLSVLEYVVVHARS
jgi:hypothetical protein